MAGEILTRHGSAVTADQFMRIKNLQVDKQPSVTVDDLNSSNLTHGAMKQVVKSIRPPVKRPGSRGNKDAYWEGLLKNVELCTLGEFVLIRIHLHLTQQGRLDSCCRRAHMRNVLELGGFGTPLFFAL